MSRPKNIKSTLGEIAYIVLGILIALQINNWSEQYKRNIEEVRILQNLREDVINDIAQLNENIQVAENRQIQIDSIFKALYSPQKYTSDEFLRLNFAIAFENHFDLNSGSFDESMAAGTVNCIRNNTLRQEIFNYYRITKLNYTDSYTVKQIYENIIPHFFKILVPSSEFINGFLNKPSALPNLDIESLTQNKDYISMITLKLRTEFHQIQSWKKYKKMAESLLDRLEADLAEKD